MLIGYARVSTTGQNLESQIEHLQSDGCDTIVQEKITGFDRRSPQLEKMLSSLQSSDTLLVNRLDRLARSTSDLSDKPGLVHAVFAAHAIAKATKPRSQFSFFAIDRRVSSRLKPLVFASANMHSMAQRVR